MDSHRKYLLILGLLVLVPLAAFFALGWRLVQDEQERTRRQFQDLLKATLAETDRAIASYFATLDQRLRRLDLEQDSVEALRERLRHEPLFEQIIVLAADGKLLYPDTSGPLSRQETDYLMKIERLISDRTLLRNWHERAKNDAVAKPAKDTSLRIGDLLKGNRKQVKQVRIEETSQPSHGWYTWYWGPGVQLIHWQGLSDGRLLAIGLQRARWMSEVVALLPDASGEIESGPSVAQIRLVNGEGRPIYTWGASQVLLDSPPLATLHLSAPLRPWQLEHFGPVEALSTGTPATLINLLAAGGLLSAGLMVLAYFLYREVGRQTREARQKVTFVNQVSHELKTPLTNIRMYADLLEQDLDRLDVDQQDTSATRHLAVIAGESGRLSRLIHNVLTFGRLNRNAHTARQQDHSVDAVIRDVLEQFQPALEQRSIEVDVQLAAPATVVLDVDALEQILGNLISNVEKYAGNGSRLTVCSRQQLGTTEVDVADTGPGIPDAFAKRVFEPFTRASDHIEAVTGTGIGLPIARELARRNGGDLVLLGRSPGATFRLTLATPAAHSES